MPSMSNIWQGLFSGAPNSIQQGLLAGPKPGGLQNPNAPPMGQWSNMAYQMAGRPQQGGALNPVPVPSGVGISGLPAAGGGGGGSGSGLLGSVLGIALKNPGLLKNLGGLLGGGTAAGTAGSAAVGAGSTLATEAGGTGLVAGTGGGLGAGAAIPAGLQASGATTFGLGAAPATSGSLYAGGAGAAAGSGAAAGGAAGGAATGGAAGEAAAGGTAAGGAGSGAGAGAATAGAVGPALGATLGIAGVLAPAIAGMLTPPVKLTSQYWTGVNNSLVGGKSNPNFYGAAMEALNMPQSQVPSNIQQLVWQSGLVAPGTWGMGAGGNGAPQFGGGIGAHSATKY